MDYRKPSVEEVWQKMKRIDAYDRIQGHQTVQANWNASIEDHANMIRRSPLSALTTKILSTRNLNTMDGQPFILGTPKYQCTPGELQKILCTAAKAVLQTQEMVRYGKVVEEEKTRPQYDLQSQEFPKEKLENDGMIKSEVLHGRRFFIKGNLEASCVEENNYVSRRSCQWSIKGSNAETPIQSQFNGAHTDLLDIIEDRDFDKLMEPLWKDDAVVSANFLSHESILSQTDNNITSFRNDSMLLMDKDLICQPISPNGIEILNQSDARIVPLEHDHKSAKKSPIAPLKKVDSSHQLDEINGLNTTMMDQDLSSALLNQHQPKDVQSNSDKDEDMMRKLNMDVNNLLDPLVDVRYKALLRIHCALLDNLPGEVHENVKEKAQDALSKHPMFRASESLTRCIKDIVIKALLRRFADKSEKSRLLSITMVTKLIHVIPDVMISLLSYILPVISERLPLTSLPTREDPSSKVEVLLVEKSEEVRLMLMTLLHKLLISAKKKIKYYASEVGAIVMAGSMDTYSEVLLETFETMTLFGELCKEKLKPIAKQIISRVLHSLSHRRHRVRVAAIKAIHRLVLCGAHESIYDMTAYCDPNLVPIRAFYQSCPKTQYLALLASDKNIQVREKLLRTVASWLRELWERKEHECRLVPYILTGFTDENPDIQDLAFQLMEEIGHQYEEENEKEVVDIQVYLQEDIDDITEAKGRFLPRAFKVRPCLGARIMVRNCLAIMLHALGGDMEAWTSDTKTLAAKFLYTLLIFAEENITMHIQPLILIMQKAFKDPLVISQVTKCANVLGFFTDPSTYLKVILPMVNGELNKDVSIRQVGTDLKLMASIMHGSPSNRLTKHVPDLCSILTMPDLLTSIQLEVNNGVMAIAEEMVRAWVVEECKEELIPLLWVLINAIAAADFCGRPTLEVEKILEGLAKASGMISRHTLLGTQAKKILDLLPHPTFWAMRSLDVLVFCRVLEVAPFIHHDMLPRVLHLLMFFGRGSTDVDIKLRLIGATQKMVENTSSILRSKQTITMIQKYFGDVLEQFFMPCLEDPLIVKQVVVALSHILSNTFFSAFVIPPPFILVVQQLLHLHHSEANTKMSSPFSCEGIDSANDANRNSIITNNDLKVEQSSEDGPKKEHEENRRVLGNFLIILFSILCIVAPNDRFQKVIKSTEALTL